MNIRKLRTLGLLSLPLGALALAAVLLSMNVGATHHASAAGTTPQYTLHIGAANTVGNVAGAVNESTGVKFTVQVSLDKIPGAYDAIAVQLAYSGVLNGTFQDASMGNPHTGNTGTAPPKNATGNWPDCVFEVFASQVAGQNGSCTVGTGSLGSTYVGNVLTTQLVCTGPGAGQIHLVHSASDTNIIDHAGATTFEAGPDQINVTCANAPTATPVPPTATPPSIPKVQKDCDSGLAGIQSLCNVFLKRQGSKIAPTTCAASTSNAVLTEQINIPVSTINPKGATQTLAAFEFEVRFDAKNVCVFLTPATNWSPDHPNCKAPSVCLPGDVICTVRDNSNSTLKGIAQIGCVTVGKGVVPAGLLMATITVKPQPELFSQIRPNQENGIPVQILNQGCQLSDDQGMAIPVFSCEDADITFRFLEGDIDGPDCDVDVFDSQKVAFAWGAAKGSLLFNSFIDLSPSGHGVNGDGRIDIADIQFVFGRFGSNCVTPWPAQLPVNPKA
jgi:hypothetical protein